MEEDDVEETQDEQYWSVYAIKDWIQEWFNRNRMKRWSIDNYDGRDSYNELSIELAGRHRMEPPLEPTNFQFMMRHMLAIELEIDDVLPTEELTMKEREREWKGLRDFAISVCNDYTPDVLQYDTSATAIESKQRLDISEGQFHYHDEIRDDRVGRNHVVSVNGRGESNGGEICCQGRRKVKEVPVAMTTMDTTMEQTKVWQPQEQIYKVGEWNRQSKEDLDEPIIGCMMAASDRSRGRRQREGDHLEGEDEELICNMTGQCWESFPLFIIIDSGACASVMPTSWCSHVPLNETPQSQAGD